MVDEFKISREQIERIRENCGPSVPDDAVKILLTAVDERDDLLDRLLKVNPLVRRDNGASSPVGPLAKDGLSSWLMPRLKK
jgi:hypothetical protein